jgi:hypothetical protein
MPSPPAITAAARLIPANKRARRIVGFIDALSEAVRFRELRLLLSRRRHGGLIAAGLRAQKQKHADESERSQRHPRVVIQFIAFSPCTRSRRAYAGTVLRRMY